jgi:predicted O-methyltransferase YrrM
MASSKWLKDLKFDIRTDTPFDDKDFFDASPVSCTWPEITDCNRNELIRHFLKVRDTSSAILEIGIFNNGAGSFTGCLLNNKKQETIYVGIDISDKSVLNNKEHNIYTIQNNSSNYEENIGMIKSFGVKQFDFIFIDGWHSINQVLDDWEYTNILSENGIVAFHDISWHPGPSKFIAAVDTNKYYVEQTCPDDWGVGFVWAK